jgi:hypothetical protein
MEIGIRIAPGADRADVVRMIVGEAAKFLAISLPLGGNPFNFGRVFRGRVVVRSEAVGSHDYRDRHGRPWTGGDANELDSRPARRPARAGCSAAPGITPRVAERGS